MVRVWAASVWLISHILALTTLSSCECASLRAHVGNLLAIAELSQLTWVELVRGDVEDLAGRQGMLSCIRGRRCNVMMIEGISVGSESYVHRAWVAEGLVL